MRKIGDMKKGIGPKLHPSVLDIAWAAGILEGEGSFGCTKSKAHNSGYSASGRVTAVQKGEWLMERLRDLFGGSIYTRENPGLGKGPVTRWMLCGPRARGLMMTIYTFMSPRRKKTIKDILQGKFKAKGQKGES